MKCFRSGWVFLSLLIAMLATPVYGQPCLPPPTGLTNWWPGDGNAKDLIGGLNGTISNGVTFAVGTVGQAFSFNGTNQFITNAVPALTNIQNSYTMEFWAKPSLSRPSTTESTSGTAGTANQRYAIFPNNGRFGAAGAGVSVGTNGISVFEHASAYLPSVLVYDAPITNWVHVAVVYSNQQPRLYLNGSLVRTGLVSARASCPSTCLGESGLGYGFYAGLLDEVSIFNRTLSSAEVLAIYNAGSAGKCPPPTPPQITVQPTNFTAAVNGNATFYVGAIGAQPLSYQWLFNGTNLANGTASALPLNNVQLEQAGNYQVIVTNTLGAATSTVATLTINSCVGAPYSGLVAWYQAEGNMFDSIGTNHGTASNLVTFVAGKYGQGFHFGGGSYVRIPENPNLVLSNEFTLELWYKAERNSVNEGLIARRNSESGPLNFNISVASGVQLDCFYNDPVVSGDTDNGGSVFEFSRITPSPTAGAFHHLVVTYRQSGANNVQLVTFLDGQPLKVRNFAGVLGRAANTAAITIGASIEYPGYEYFQGTIDDVALFNRALTTNEVAALFATGDHGGCYPPTIVIQPTNQTVLAGFTATFNVLALGTAPLSYQWSFNGTNIVGATTNSLSLPNVQTNQAGNYQVRVSNAAGVTNSVSALLTVPTPTCTPPGSNMVSWWRGEGDASDAVSGNNGTLWNGVAFAPARSGQGFVFNGNGTAVSLGNPTNLQLQNFTIETWIRRASDVVTSSNGTGNGHIFAFDNGGYGLYLTPSGVPVLSKIGISAVSPTASITDTNLHHLAVTKSGSSVFFHVDGVAYPAASFNQTFTFAGNAYIGGLITNNTFFGTIDELAIYSRALSTNEVVNIYNAVSANKCALAGYAPFFITQPASQSVLVGTDATLLSIAAGTAPLSYQWSFNSNNIPGATNASLVLSNVSGAQSGAYAVTVTNLAGNVSSSNAIVTVSTCVGGAYPGLVAWYQAEGNMFDSVGTNHGTASNLVTFVPGKYGQGFHFGGGSYVRIPANPNLVLSNEFTLELWYKAERNSVNEGLIARRNSESAPLNFNISVASGVQMDCFYNDPAVSGDTDSAGSVFEISRVSSPVAGPFHHLVVTYRQSGANTVQLVTFLDGQPLKVRNFGGVLGRAANSAPITIGASIEYPGYEYFQGTIDDVALFNRALTTNEVAALFVTGDHSACIPPTIVVQPTNQTVIAGLSTSLSVAVVGTAPLSYQWSFNGTNIAGATTNSLSLPNVQSNQAGNYQVRISNSVGVTNSAIAILTVPTPTCVSGSNLVSWWRGEGNALDAVSGNNGILSNNVTFTAARAGQGLTFDGNGSVVTVGNPSNLQLQNFTIETWIRRASDVVTSSNGTGNGHIFAFDNGGYGLYLTPSGVPTLSKIGFAAVGASTSVTDTNLHHLAVTKSNTTVVFFLDGVAYPAAAFNQTFTFAGNVYLGGLITNNTFFGTIDELAIYSRALSTNEVSNIYNAVAANKCALASYAPFLITQPTNQTLLVGANVTLPSVAAGTAPLVYQWSFNSNNIPGATNASLILSNAGLAQSGVYAVTVTNIAGKVSSSNVTISINYPLPIARLNNTNVSAGNAVTVPVTFAANGNENAFAFSVNYDTTRLTFANANLGSGAGGAFLQPNTSQTNLGRIGISVIMPFGTTFTPGTQTVAQLTFNATVFTNGSPVASSLTFGDLPTPRQLLDVQPAFLPAGYSNGVVTIIAATNYIAPTNFEGDVFPRPGGDRTNSLIDWLYLGRYVARLDFPTNAAEFQRADSAPRATFGDGTIRVTDWVQAGRYSFGLDAQTPGGGPTNEVAPTAPIASATRILSTTGANLLGGNSTTVSVSLAAQGNENAIGFTISFDPALVNYTGATLGAGAAGTTFYVNTNQLATGKVGFVLGQQIGNTFAAGARELAQIGFQAAPLASGNFALSFVDAPVAREISDNLALGLPVSFSAGQVEVFTPPTLRIATTGTNVLVGWPLWASNYTLQEAALGAGWTNVAQPSAVVGSENVITLSPTNASRYYRLIKP